jgi:hypothetical protein
MLGRGHPEWQHVYQLNLIVVLFLLLFLFWCKFAFVVPVLCKKLIFVAWWVRCSHVHPHEMADLRYRMTAICRWLVSSWCALLCSVVTYNILQMTTQKYAGSILVSNQLSRSGRILLTSLIIAQLLNKFPTFYRTLGFITLFTTALASFSLPLILTRRIHCTLRNCTTLWYILTYFHLFLYLPSCFFWFSY